MLLSISISIFSFYKLEGGVLVQVEVVAMSCKCWLTRSEICKKFLRNETLAGDRVLTLRFTKGAKA